MIDIFRGIQLIGYNSKRYSQDHLYNVNRQRKQSRQRIVTMYQLKPNSITSRRGNYNAIPPDSSDHVIYLNYFKILENVAIKTLLCFILSTAILLIPVSSYTPKGELSSSTFGHDVNYHLADTGSLIDERLLMESIKPLIEHGYHDNNEIHLIFANLSKKFPSISKNWLFGKTISKEKIYALKMTSSIETSIGEKPLIVVIGGIHGDHALGHEFVIYLAHLLAENYQPYERVRSLLDTFEIIFIPTLNPDGFKIAKEGNCHSSQKRSGRNNLADIDLDTDFKFHNFNHLDEISGHDMQKESQVIFNLAKENSNRLQLVLTLRTGLTGITYPFDEAPNQTTEQVYDDQGHSLNSNPSPDQDLFVYLGYQVFYSLQPNPIDSQCTPLGNNITVLDGAQLGSIYGSMNDFLYRFTNALPMNIYLDCCKYPAKSDLESKWLQHADSILSLIESSKLGVKGHVVDVQTGKSIPNASISITGLGKSIKTNEKGLFWRMLIPYPTYELVIDADGYKQIRLTGIRASQLNGTVGLEIKMQPVGSQEKEIILNATQAIDIGPMDEQKRSEISSTTVSVLKPDILFKDVDKQIENLDFKTPTNLKKHHNYQEMKEFLIELTRQYPKISKLYSIGKSVENRDLYVIEISDKPGVHQFLKPEFRYVANMHGNEAVGREVVLNLAKLILENYETNPLVTALVNTTRIHLMPSLNPDGYEISVEGDCEGELGRKNAKDVDLNRNFPDRRFPDFSEREPIQPEVEAFIKWSMEHPFVLGANLHGGSLVANYPFDGNADKIDGLYSASPDDKLFKHLASTYSKSHRTMSKGEHCYDICGKDRNSLLNERFIDGITNGASWYVLYGGIQDWVYLNSNCLSITLELGCTKFPLSKHMPRYWSDNKKPLMKFMLEIHRGIFGSVIDGQTNQPIANATIKIKDLDHDVYSSESGEYWRILLPGEYQISVSKDHYRTAHRSISVGAFGSPAVRINFSLISGPKDLSNSLDIVDDSLPLSGNSQATLDGSTIGNNNNGDLSSVNKPKLRDTNPNGNPMPIKNSNPNLEASAAAGHKQKNHNTLRIQGNQSSLTVDGSSLVSDAQPTRYLLALCFLIVLPGLLLLVYMLGLSGGSAGAANRLSKLGFSPLANHEDVEDEDDDDDDDNNNNREGVRFVRKGKSAATKFKSLKDGQNSESEDELYNADDWSR